LTVKLNLTLHKKHTRKYPLIQIGDRVKIYRKKKTGEKERTSTWSENTYEVEKIIQSLGQTCFIVNGLEKHYMRSELLKI
jgi:hypothetical protein